MTAVMVVIGDPVVGSCLGLRQAVEQVGVEHLVAEALVEALDEGVLVRLAGLDEAQLDALRLGPIGEGISRHLRTVVQTDRLRRAVDGHQLVEHPGQAHRGDRGADLDAQRLAVALVDDVERPERPPVVKRVAHEVQGPDVIQTLGLVERLERPRQDAPLGPARQVQAHVAVHPMHTFVIPAMTIRAQTVEALPEAPARTLGHHRIERVDNRGVEHPPIHHWPVQHRPRQACDSAGPDL